RILSETASAGIASPTNIPFDKLTPQIGVDPKVRSWNFPLVWPGGEWKLANIVDYMQSGAFALLRNAARYRERWLRDFYRIGKEAVRERKPGEPFALLIPPLTGSNFWQLDGLRRLESILGRGEVETITAATAFEADAKQYPPNTKIVPLAQPYGAFAKTLLERQRYPDLREYPGGPPRRPYDVTAHTLPLLFGVDVAAVMGEPPATGGIITPMAEPHFTNALSDRRTRRIAIFRTSGGESMDDGWTRWVFDKYRVPFTTITEKDVAAGGLNEKFDAIVVPDQAPTQLTRALGEAGTAALGTFVDAGGSVLAFNDASAFV